MSCEQIELWMMDALDGMLAPAERQRMMSHLATCSRCSAEWQALNAVENMLAEPPMAQPAPGLAGRVDARLEQIEARRRTLIGGLILIAAAASLCLLAVPSLLNGRNPLEAYGAFLQGTYAFLTYAALVTLKLLSALRLTLDTLARSLDVPLLNLLIYVLGTLMALAAWRRSLAPQYQTTETARER